MPQYRTFQTTFTSGEFDQKLRDRTDIRSFFEGAQKMRNFALLAQGGFTRRPGSFIRNACNMGRILPFEYSAADALILNLFDEGFEVFALDGTLQGTAVGAPWTLDQLFTIKWVQRGNAMILTHQDWEPHVLTRNPETNGFDLAPFSYGIDGNGVPLFPYTKKNRSNTNEFTTSALTETGAAVTITCTEDYFIPAHVGTSIRLEGGYAEITGYTDARTVTANQFLAPQRNLIGNPFYTSDGSNIVQCRLGAHGFSVGQVININSAVGVGGLTAAQLNGDRTVTRILSTSTFEFTAGANATSTEEGGGAAVYLKFTGPTPFVREQSFSAVNGYPGAVGIHEERLWFGGTVAQPDGLWGSYLSQFDNFDIGEGLPDEGLSIILDTGSVNEIRHLVSSRHLQVLTNENEFYVPSGDQTPITPENFVIRKQTPFGSSNVRAALFDGATIFCQESGRSVREFLYTDREFAYNARNIALLAQHLIENPKELQTVYGGLVRPEEYGFFLNETGTITVLHAIRSEEIIGWTQWETQGTFEGVAVVGQRVFVTNQHPDTTWYLEELDFEFVHFMDGVIGFDQTGNPSTVWGPAPEYANQEVAVTSGDYFLGYITLDADGYFTTDDPYETVEIGLNYLAEAQTMQTAFQLPDGPMTGLPIRLTRAVVDFGASRTMYVEGQRLILRDTTDFPPDLPPDADRKEEFWMNIISRNPSVEFVSDLPLEATVYSIMIEVAF